MRAALRLALAALWLCGGGCSWLWPTVVRTSPSEPLFHTGFPLVGGLRLDGALCSLVSIGPDATRVVSCPEPLAGAVPPEEACGPGRDEHGRVARLVRVETRYGPVHGYVFAVRPATGVLVAFAGLGMPPDGWINSRFAAVASRQGFVTFAPVRDESPHPIYFDPVREARRATEAARLVGEACHVGAPADLAFVGISLGGLEALLANRDALERGLATRAAVLDPVLDVHLATANLDSFWHGIAVDSVQGYFRRILTGRYGEDPPPQFEEVMNRTSAHPEAMTALRSDAPSAWLCGAQRDAFAVFLSDTDPVLGDAQRDFAERCGFPLRRARVPGHTPLACRLELFDEMIAELRPPPRTPAATLTSGATERRREPVRETSGSAPHPSTEPPATL
jgi:hypothetical protein